MKSIVTKKRLENTLTILKKEAVVSSVDIAKVFEKQHKHTLEKIREIINSLTAEKAAIKNYFIDGSYINEKGRTYTRYLITRKGFDLLALSFTGKKAFKYKLWYIDAFHKMASKIEADIRQSIINQKDDLWLQFRKESRIIRKELTDAIKKYVADYRREVEHKMNDGRFYQHYTNLIYKILKIDLPKGANPRDVLGIRQIVRVEDMEIRVANLIEKYSNQGMHYKEVYKKIKKTLSS